MNLQERRRLFTGLLFASPWLVSLVFFLVGPILAALALSFTDYSVLLSPVFIGFENYRDLFADPLFYQSLYNTVVYALGSVLFGMLVSLSLALLLHAKIFARGLWRTIFFLPSLMPVVATSVLFMWIFNGQSGVLNSLLASVGIRGPAWLADPDFAKPAMIMMAVWGSGHAMVVLLAGLEDIPQALHEAAIIDGANWVQRLLNVTIPMLSPVLYFNLVMGTIASFQVFTQAFIMTGATGAPERSTLFYVLHLYNVGFQDLRMGYACAMAFILFVIIVTLTLTLTRLSSRFVVYDR